MKYLKHRWFSGRMLACHAGGPGSIPGRCKIFLDNAIFGIELKDCTPYFGVETILIY